MTLSPKVTIGLRIDGQKGLFLTANARQDEVLIAYDGPIIDHPTRYSVQIDDDRHIEGTAESNAYLNHSCAPNAYVDWNGVCLRALRDMAPGEELTCNYLTTDYEIHETFVCHCGAPGCYGEIKGFKHLPKTEQLKLERYIPAFMKRKLTSG